MSSRQQCLDCAKHNFSVYLYSKIATTFLSLQTNYVSLRSYLPLYTDGPQLKDKAVEQVLPEHAYFLDGCQVSPSVSARVEVAE